MTSLRRFSLLPVLALAVLGGLLVGHVGTSPADAVTTYSVTITGAADMHSLDPAVGLKIIPNTGGGVIATGPTDGSVDGPVVADAPITLPVGAKVTSVAVTVTGTQSL